MLIGLEGFGSIWSVRRKSNPLRVAYYNTTGVLIDGRLRHRAAIFGAVRFNQVGGFDANHIERNIGRVFESAGPIETGPPSLLLHHLANPPASPDLFLFAVSSDRAGTLRTDNDGWKSDTVMIISLSEWNGRQEALLLMPAHSWIRGALGRLVVEPRTDRSWRAFLRLVG
jgi:hypothetical protein